MKRIAFGLVAAALWAGTASAQPAPAPTPPGPGQVVWSETVDAARVRAEREGKFVYIEFDRKNCGHCQRMDNLLYPAMDFEALMVPMAPVKVDLDTPMAQEIAKRYGIEEAPAVLVTTPEGRAIFATQGFEGASVFYREIHKAMRDYRDFARRIDSQDINNLPAREALQTGSELYRRSDPGAALPRLRRAAAAAGSDASLRDNALELLARSQIDLGQVSDAEATLESLRRSKDPARRERAALLHAQAPFAANQPEEAMRRLEKFLADFPSSPEAPAVREMIQRILREASR